MAGALPPPPTPLTPLRATSLTAHGHFQLSNRLFLNVDWTVASDCAALHVWGCALAAGSQARQVGRVILPDYRGVALPDRCETLQVRDASGAVLTYNRYSPVSALIANSAMSGHMAQWRAGRKRTTAPPLSLGGARAATLPSYRSTALEVKIVAATIQLVVIVVIKG